MPATLGEATVTVIEQIEAHKFHMEFEAGGTIVAGDLVKLVAADADVVSAADSDDENLVIGMAIMDALDTENVTIALRGYALVNGEAEGTTETAQPVELGPFNSTTGLREYLLASNVDRTVGWNIVPTTVDGAALKVILKA